MLRYKLETIQSQRNICIISFIEFYSVQDTIRIINKLSTSNVNSNSPYYTLFVKTKIYSFVIKGVSNQSQSSLC